MYHIHHIVPRHMGGTDDPTNLVRISPTCHTMWHWCEWKRTGSIKHQGAYNLLRGHIHHNEPPLHERAKKLPKKIIRFYGVVYVNNYLDKRKSRLSRLVTQFKKDYDICHNSPGFLDSIYSGNLENKPSHTNGS